MAVPARLVDEHLVGCAGCRAWLTSAEQLNRRIRVRPAATVPDLSAEILAASASTVGGHRASRLRVPIRRWLLGGVAVAQLAVVVTDQLSSHHLDEMAGGGAHLFNEGVAWNVALSVGFAAAALRPRLAAGMLPTLSAFVAVLSVFAVADLVGGRAGVLREGSHLLVVAGLVLLWLVARDLRGPRRAARVADQDGRIDLDDLSGTRANGDDAAPRSGRRGLRPAGRRVA